MRSKLERNNLKKAVSREESPSSNMSVVIEESELKEGELPINKIIHGNVLNVLKKLPSDSVDCIVTSPPYWGLRDYGEEANTIWDGDPNCEHEWEFHLGKKYTGGTDNTFGQYKDEHTHFQQKFAFCKKCGAWYGQLGLEPTLDMYIEHMLQITKELKRVLKPTGVMFWNHGDNYSTNPPGNKMENYQKWAEKGDGLIGRLAKRNQYGSAVIKSRIPKKCMCMQNYRLVIRMIDEQGWILRNIIIWCLSEDTKIFVKRNGKYFHIPIKDIKEGDFVPTIDREYKLRWVRIKKKINAGIRKVLKIITKSGKEVICTGEHQFPVKCSYNYGKFLKLRFKKSKDLATKDFLWVNYHLPNILPKGSKEDYKKGFIVGFFLAEGSYRKRKIGIYKDNKFSKYAQKRWGRLKKPKVVYDRVEFACGKKDLERGYLEYLKLYNIKIKNYKGDALIVYSSDKSLLNLIRTFIKGEKCNKKHFSQEIWNTSLQFIKGVVDGFLAGDGNFDEKNGRWRVRIKPNQKLKEDLELACRLIGYEFRYEGIYDTNYGTKAMGFVIRKNIKRKTFGFMYADQIENIEEIGEKEVYDIEVEPIYTSYCGKGKTDKPTKEKIKAKWNNLYFLANGIWTHNSKPNHMPSSVKDRFTNAYEPVFMLVKRKKYWFDLDAVRVPHKSSTIERYKYPLAKFGADPNNPFGRLGKGIKSGSEGKIVEINPLGKNPGDVWEISTQPFHDAHFAVFPEKLVEPMIKTGCPKWICKKCGKPRVRITKTERTKETKNISDKNLQEKKKGYIAQPLIRYEVIHQTIGWTDCGCNAGWKPGIVLDPFLGSGTTALVALKLGRNFLGIEINKKYCEMAYKRIKPYMHKRINEFVGNAK